MRHDLRLRLLAAAGPGDRLPAEAIERLALYTSLSLFDMVASPQVGLAKMLTLLCSLMLIRYASTPLMYRILAWSASLVTRLRQSGWHAALAWALGLAVGGIATIAMCQMVFGLGTVGSMFFEYQRGYAAVDDGLSAEQRLVAKQQLVLIAAVAGGLRMRN